MTFAEFMMEYGSYYRSRGEVWLGDFIDSLIQKGISTEELVSNQIQELHRELKLTDRDDLVAIGYAWSKRDRLVYLIIDWWRHLKTGEKYF